MKKFISYASVVILLGLFIYGFFAYKKVFTANTNVSKTTYIFIPSNANFQTVKDSLAKHIINMDNFVYTAETKGFDKEFYTGRFALEPNMNNYSIIIALSKNVPLRVSYNNQETIADLANRLAQQTEPSAEDYLQAFTEPYFLEEFGLNEDNVLSVFIPNTYEFYWNVSAPKVRDRLVREYKKFWNEERKAKADSLGLTPLQVVALASIVQKETAKVDERPKVAGAYLNRLRINMPLQADPTVIYAIKKESGDYDQVIKRVLHNDLKINSPYNTYVNAGLPPGPITMPDISSIDAVLNAENHDYIYFCASVDNFGYHVFASNYNDHLRNASKYSKWVASQNYVR
ncbi:endolytic transglycosylase MltG [Flavobacterium agricola]|uniref:Endolytic murein transglycosylase n=1 Tax=Flavobacterium agricola TaxID=2870839 RepID=A0ABY6LYN0_9FLAO|nr:endolytic transglycosylase MltG [Flavobacterium agricola]UYW01432.1 endolytic transglycosylase MltG [Flavobacterium agricola]